MQASECKLDLPVSKDIYINLAGAEFGLKSNHCKKKNGGYDYTMCDWSKCQFTLKKPCQKPPPDSHTHRVWPQLFVEPFKSPSADPWQPLVEASVLVAKGWDVLDQKILPLTLPPSPSLPIPLPTPFPTHPRTAAKTTHIHALTSASYIARNILVVLFFNLFFLPNLTCI